MRAGRGVFKDAADVILCRLRKAGITAFIEEDVCIPLPQGRVDVHAGPVVAKQRLWHERDGLAVLTRNVLDDVFVEQGLSAMRVSVVKVMLISL